ncbi:MAG TPA: hypothetical protein VGE15_12180, partial [Sphingobacteriaceae bacterium]
MRIAVILVLLGLPFCSVSQTWDEIFKQKKTQKEYLLQQLLALKIYAGYLKEGYETIHVGLTTVQEITGGELALHSLFFSSLARLNPVIKNSPRIGDVLRFNATIRKNLDGLSSLELSRAQRDYVLRVRSQVLEELEIDLEELATLIADGNFKMDDEERLRRLQSIHERSLDKLQFTRFFVREVRELLLLKDKGGRDTQVLKSLY